MKCSSCGKTIRWARLFCFYCGATNWTSIVPCAAISLLLTASGVSFGIGYVFNTKPNLMYFLAAAVLFYLGLFGIPRYDVAGLTSIFWILASSRKKRVMAVRRKYGLNMASPANGTSQHQKK
jgi:hypothetical protein